jgi:hypothetical protein
MAANIPLTYKRHRYLHHSYYYDCTALSKLHENLSSAKSFCGINRLLKIIKKVKLSVNI